MVKFCACGCGKRVKANKRYRQGHNGSRGKSRPTDRPTDRLLSRRTSVNGGGFDGVLAELKEKREKINNVIEAIQELQ